VNEREAAVSELSRVMFLPYESWRNPYQSRLARALDSKGVQVRPASESSLAGALRARRRGELELVHLHWTSALLLSSNRVQSILKTALFILACRALKLQGVKLIWTLHNIFDHERRDPAWEANAQRMCCLIYDRIIVHCPAAIELVQGAYRLPAEVTDRFVVIPHGHFSDQYPKQIMRDEARQVLEIPEDEHVFLFFGQIRPYKNLVGLLEAFNQLDEPKSRLLIAGEPANDAIREEIQRATAGNPQINTYLGRVADTDIQTYMNAADVVTLPFGDILTSSTVILVSSFGKATITPRMGCSPEVLAGQPELLYDPGEPEGLLKRMRASLAIDLEMIGRQAQESVRPNSWETVGAMTAAVYSGCLDVR
jgi:glycosyltransferase involved in cell wall biosynthesis